MAEQIIKTEFSDVMQKSYIDYAMSVITQRALPDVRDGLKPVQRRVLYAMQELGLFADRPHRKSARIVGDTMGKYHPHGDTSIYEALVVMEQEFKKGMPLVDGHGNFGSIEGDGAAAMRYTEAKLQKFTQDVYLKDLDKNVVDFVPNFDETEREPEVLPVRIPNILINGAEGIAVGMTTSIPPHNLCEVVDGVMAYIDNPDITTQELMEYIKGPDFPTGGLIVNEKDLAQIYETGTGKLKVRGKVVVEKPKRKSGRAKLVVTEIPYTMVGAGIGRFISDVVSLIENRTLGDIVDISNESSKEGVRIVLELKKDADVTQITNILYKKTRLEDTFGVNMLAISEGRPELLSLKQIIESHTVFHREVLTRKYETLLAKELEQKEIKEGLIKACDMIDLIIEILRGSSNIKEARNCLIHGDTGEIRFKTAKSKKAASRLSFTEKQATAILEMRLYRLIGLEILALQEEYARILNNISLYQDILQNPSSMKKVMKKDLAKIRKEYGFDRKTELINAKAVVIAKKPVEEKEVYFVMDRFGYIKTLDHSIYDRNQEAVIQDYRTVIPCLNTGKICVFTDTGLMHQIKVSDLPAGRLRDKGTPIDNLSNFDSQSERIVLVCDERALGSGDLFFVTEKSMMKMVDGQEFLASKKTIQATRLAEDDRVCSIHLFSKSADGEKKKGYVILQSEGGYFLRFALEEVVSKKKAALGIHGMNLGPDDQVKNVYLYGCQENSRDSVIYKDKELVFSKIKIMKHNAKGVKVRR